VTSSFALLNPEKTHVLMIHHLGFNKWLFPGGHYEGQVTPRISALRELEEETGFPAASVEYLDDLGYLAIDLDTHAIEARPSKNEAAHWHHDFLYLGVALRDHPLTHQVEEVAGAEWISLDQAANLPDERVRRAVAKIIDMVRE
jgi:8-oxo-dGTP pyrophosphatase MutT (NUDIX family)